MKKDKFILASTSPRRKELLAMINIYPEIITPDYDELQKNNEPIYDFLKRVSIGKGKSIKNKNNSEKIIISSDTIVFINNRIIGKPKDRTDAFNILKILSNNDHMVITGIAIQFKDKCLYDFRETKVSFESLTDNEINYYLDNENYIDKAGAYAIQGLASVFIKKIDGCYFNVMGFPLNLFSNMLKKIQGREAKSKNPKFSPCLFAYCLLALFF